MKDRIVVSIPHTGTNFIAQRLGIQQIIHSHTPLHTLMREIAGKQIVTPLRHPVNVWDSWCKRYKSDESFAHITFGFAWRTIDWLDYHYDIDFIDLEAQSDPRIEDWEPVASDEREPNNIPPVLDFNKLWQLRFVAAHYEWTPEMDNTWRNRVYNFRSES